MRRAFVVGTLARWLRLETFDGLDEHSQADLQIVHSPLLGEQRLMQLILGILGKRELAFQRVEAFADVRGGGAV